jgi:uncharacterized protein (UPF0548 family)
MAVQRLDERRARALATRSLSYPEVGGTDADQLPDGYRHIERAAVIGHGPDVFERAASELLAWQAHAGAGLLVGTSAPRAEVGVDVLLAFGVGPLRLSAACRVVAVLDEAHRQGFSYGTLTGHPESGEEAFVVELLDDDGVQFAIRGFSRPASPLTRVAGPLGRAAQDRVIRRYLAALRQV